MPIADDRRRFFESRIREARPHIGYKLLCLLAEAEIIQSVWTTNFDGLVSRAAANFDLTPVEIGIDCQSRVYRQPTRGELACISLHGDYRYDALKNTAEELQNQEKSLIDHLTNTLQTHSLIVSGYSGRDQSIMEALHDAITRDEAQRKVFWCGYSSEPSAPILNLLKVAKDSGREAYYVSGVSFDDLMTRLAFHCLDGERLNNAKAIIGDKINSNLPEKKMFKIDGNNPTSLVKSNAWRIQLPSEVFSFNLNSWPEQKAWKWLEQQTSGYKIIAVPFKTVIAFGTSDDIQACFVNQIKASIERIPVSDKDIRYEYGAVLSLMRKAIVQSIATHRNLNTDGSALIWLSKSSQKEKVGNRMLESFEVAKIHLRTIEKKTYLTIDPTIYIPSASEEEMDEIKKLRMHVLGYQHNKEYNESINKWRDRLFKRGEEFDFPAKSAAFKFIVQNSPVFAGIYERGEQKVDIQDKYKRLICHQGIVVPDPKLGFFENADGKVSLDSMPLRGLHRNGPYDQRLNIGDGIERLHAAVICPKLEASLLERFLSGIDCSHSPQRGHKEEYLVPYPGFTSTFKMSVLMPNPKDTSWLEIPEIDSALDEKEGSLILARKVCDAVSSISSRSQVPIIIYIPERWRKWWRFETGNEILTFMILLKLLLPKEAL